MTQTKTTSASAYSLEQNSFLAGKEMAEKAFSKMDADHVDFAFVFATSDHDANELLKGIRTVIGEDTPLTGGTTVGVITNEHIGYAGFQAGIMLIASDEMQFQTTRTEGLHQGEYEAGKKAGRELKKIMNVENPNLLILYDLVQRDPDSLIPFYQTAPILDGIESEIGKLPPSAGVGYATGVDRRQIEMWDKETITSDAIMPVLISGNVRMHTTIMHCMYPVTDYHTITKCDGPKIIEIDNRPAIEIANEYLGEDLEIDWKEVTFLLFLGIHRGKKYESFNEEDYVNRMVLGVNESEGAMYMIEGDFREGDEFQFMQKLPVTDAVAEGAKKLLDSLDGRQPVFALYISCAGRVKPLFGSEKEEAEEIQETVGKVIPVLGLYSGVEIAEVKGKLMPLDWTGVLCVFSVPQ